jgi:hypothetical protein
MGIVPPPPPPPPRMFVSDSGRVREVPYDTGEPDPSIEGPPNIVVGEDLDPVGELVNAARFVLAVLVATGIVLTSVRYAPVLLEEGSDIGWDILDRIPREFAYTAVASLVGSALWALLRGAWPKPLRDGERNPSAKRETGRKTEWGPAPKVKPPRQTRPRVADGGEPVTPMPPGRSIPIEVQFADAMKTNAAMGHKPLVRGNRSQAPSFGDGMVDDRGGFMYRPKDVPPDFEERLRALLEHNTVNAYPTGNPGTR